MTSSGLPKRIISVAAGVGSACVAVLALAAGPGAQGNVAPAGDIGRLNHVIEKLERGEPVIGTFPGQMVGTIAGARQIGSSNNDFVMFDLQYGTFDVGPIQQTMFSMINKGEMLKRRSLGPLPTPMARIPEWAHETPEFAAKQLLDIGLFGVMFPHMESRQQAEQAVKAMRYPQRAGANFERPGSTRNDPVEAFWYWGVSKEQYMPRADVWPLNPRGELLAVLQIESEPGVKHLDEILSVPGLGALLIGPSHLSQSLGEPGAKSPKTEAAVQTIVKACVAKRVPCAYPIVEETSEKAKAEVARRQAEGFRILTVNVNGRPGGAP